MKLFNTLKHTTWFLIFCLILESPVFAGIPLSIGNDPISKDVLHFHQEFLKKNFTVERDSINKNLSQKPFCILIGDAHGNEEAQQSIWSFMEALKSKGLRATYLVEGISGELLLNEFKSMPNSPQKRKIVYEWFKKGDLSPVEANAILNPDTKVFGLEYLPEYIENVELYWKVKKNQKTTLLIFEKVYSELKSELAKKVNSTFLELNTFEQLLEALNQNPKKILEIFNHEINQVSLEKLARFQKSFPTLNAFFSFVFIHQTPKEKEREQFKSLFKNQSALAQSLSSEYPAFYQFLLMNRVSNSSQVEKWLMKPILEKLIRLELTPEEWRSLRKLAKGQDEAISQTIRLLRSFGARNNNFKDAVHFYELATKRDEIFRREFKRYQENHPKEKVFVFVMGGFHLDEFKAHLEQMEYPHLVLKPKMAKPDESNYESKMLELARLSKSTVALPFALEEYPGLNDPRRTHLITELSHVRSELRVKQSSTRRTFLSTAAAGAIAMLTGCAVNNVVPGIPRDLAADPAPKSKIEIPLATDGLERELAQTNRLAFQRLQVFKAYLAYLKTLPEFTNWDLGASFGTEFSKVIGSRIRGKMSQRELFVREKINKLAGAVIGAAVNNVSMQAPKIADITSALGNELAGRVSGKLLPEQPGDVDYGVNWGDLGIAIALSSAPAMSFLDAIPVEGNAANLLWSINTPFGFSVGPSSGNIATLSQNQQIALNLLREIVRYRQLLRSTSEEVLKLYQAVELANVELLRLLSEVHTLNEQLTKFRTTLKKNVSKNEIERLSLLIQELGSRIKIQITTVNLLQASADLLFQKSPQDVRTWVISTGAGKRSAFHSAYNMNAGKTVRGTQNLPAVPYLQHEDGVIFLSPSDLGQLIDSLVTSNIINSDGRNFMTTWANRQISLAGSDSLNETEILGTARTSLDQTLDTSEVQDLRLTIGFDQETIRQTMLALHPEATFGVDSGLTASPINKVDTWTWTVPLVLDIRIPLGTKNTEVSIREGEVDIEFSNLAIQETLKSRKDSVGTLIDNLGQVQERKEALKAVQARIQSRLAEYGRTRSDYAAVPASIEKDYLPLVQEAINIRMELNLADIEEHYLLWQLQILNGDRFSPEALPATDQISDHDQMLREGVVPRSELRKLYDKAFIDEITKVIAEHKETLDGVSEIIFAGNRILFEKTAAGFQITGMRLRFSNSELILLLLEEQLLRMEFENKLNTFGGTYFQNNDEAKYAVFFDMISRLVEQILKSRTLTQFILEDAAFSDPAKDYLVTRIVKAVIRSEAKDLAPDSSASGLRMTDNFDQAIWNALESEATETTSVSNAILLPRDIQNSIALTRTLRNDLPVVRLVQPAVDAPSNDAVVLSLPRPNVILKPEAEEPGARLRMTTSRFRTAIPGIVAGILFVAVVIAQNITPSFPTSSPSNAPVAVKEEKAKKPAAPVKFEQKVEVKLISIKSVAPWVELPKLIKLKTADGKIQETSWQEAFQTVKERFQTLKNVSSEKENEWPISERDSFQINLDLDQWTKLLAQYNANQNKMKPQKNTATPWNYLFNEALAQIAEADRERDTWERGDSSVWDYHIHFIEAYLAIRDLEEALQSYSSLRLTGEMPLQPNIFSVTVDLSQKTELIDKLGIQITLETGETIQIGPTEITWIQKERSKFVAVFSHPELQPIDISDAALVETNSTSDGLVAIWSSEQNVVRLSEGERLVALEAPYFTQVSEGNTIGTIVNPALEFQIESLKRKIKDFELKQMLLSGNLKYISATTVESERGASIDQITAEINRLEGLIETLEAQRSEGIMVAPASGLFIPAGTFKSDASFTVFTSGVIGQVIPLEEAPNSRSELRFTTQDFFLALRNLLPISKPEFTAPTNLELPWSARLNSARERSELRKLFPQHPKAIQELSHQSTTPKILNNVRTLLVTDFASISTHGFRQWQKYLPQPDQLKWFILVSKANAGSLEFGNFKEKTANFKPQILIYDDRTDQASLLKKIGRITSAWEPEIVKLISPNDFPSNVKWLEKIPVIAACFSSEIHAEFETWFYARILTLQNAQELLTQFKSITLSTYGNWARITFDFTQLFLELATEQAVWRAA